MYGNKLYIFKIKIKNGKKSYVLTNIHASSVYLLILINRKQMKAFRLLIVCDKRKLPYVKLAKTFGYTQIN